MHRLAQRATPEMKSDMMKIIESMKTLEPHITKARYPVLKGLELLPPSRFYTKDIAEKALVQARKVLEKVKSLLGTTKL